MTTPTELWLMLFSHDWTYQYSDDGSAYRRGQDSIDAITRAAHESDENRALYDSWMDMRKEGVYTGPTLTHKGCDIVKNGYQWDILFNGSVVDTAPYPSKAVEMINEQMMVVEEAVAFSKAMDNLFSPIIDDMEKRTNIIPFPLERRS